MRPHWDILWDHRDMLWEHFHQNESLQSDSVIIVLNVNVTLLILITRLLFIITNTYSCSIYDQMSDACSSSHISHELYALQSLYSVHKLKCHYPAKWNKQLNSRCVHPLFTPIIHPEYATNMTHLKSICHNENPSDVANMNIYVLITL
jgi:hypothetical protein